MVNAQGKTSQETLRDCGFVDRDPKLSEQENHRRRWCNDMDDETAKWALFQTCPEPPGGLTGPVVNAPYPSWVPTTYIVTTMDRAIPEEIQRKLLRNLGTPAVEAIHSGHGAMISDPKGLADLLLKFA